MNKFLNNLFLKKKLQLVDPSKEISESYILKSNSNLFSSKLLLKNNLLEEAVSLSYFSMYHLCLSLFFKVGIKCENHTACAIILKDVFNLDNTDLIKAKTERIDKQYYTEFKTTKEGVELAIKIAEDFNRNLKGFILNVNNLKISEWRNKFKELLK
jgi:uncharacterized protein (UPF0332 family)